MFSHLIPVHLLALIITICGNGNCESVKIASQETVLIEHDLYVTFEEGGGGCSHDVETDQICNTREEVGNISIIFVGHPRGRRPLPIKIDSCVGVSVMSGGETLCADVNCTEIAR